MTAKCPCGGCEVLVYEDGALKTWTYTRSPHGFHVAAWLNGHERHPLCPNEGGCPECVTPLSFTPDGTPVAGDRAEVVEKALHYAATLQVRAAVGKCITGHIQEPCNDGSDEAEYIECVKFLWRYEAGCELERARQQLAEVKPDEAQ